MAEEIRILLLEDLAADADLLRIALEKAGLSHIVRRVDTEQEFVQALRDFVPDVIISDYTLPGFDGTAALKLARSLRPDVPFVFFSGTISEEMAIEALSNGAADYVLKDRMKRLPSVLRRVLAEANAKIARHQSEQARLKAEHLYYSLAELSHDAVLALRNGQVVLINKAGLALYGAKRHGELVGRLLTDFIHQDSREEFAGWLKTLDSPGRHQTVQRHVMLDGTSITVEMAAARVDHQNESVVLIVARRVA